MFSRQAGIMLMQRMRGRFHCDLVNNSWRACQREVVNLTDFANFSCVASTWTWGGSFISTVSETVKGLSVIQV